VSKKDKKNLAGGEGRLWGVVGGGGCFFLGGFTIGEKARGLFHGRIYRMNLIMRAEGSWRGPVRQGEKKRLSLLSKREPFFADGSWFGKTTETGGTQHQGGGEKGHCLHLRGRLSHGEERGTFTAPIFRRDSKSPAVRGKRFPHSSWGTGWVREISSNIRGKGQQKKIEAKHEGRGKPAL